MTPDEPEQGGQDVLTRYHRASATENARPAEATRAAILAEARRIAAEQASPEALKPFDTRTGAANQPRWRLAAVGTLGIAAFAVLLMVPYLRPHPPATQALAPAPRMNSLNADASVGPLRGYAERPPAEPLQAPPAADAQANLTPPATAALKRATPDAAPRQRSEARTLDKLAEAPREALADNALAARSAAAAAPPALYSTAPRRSVHTEPSPLLQAVMTGDIVEARNLLDHGAFQDALDDYGHSALFLAVMQRRGDLVRLLLAHGADPLIADSSGQTPLEWARQHYFDDMVQSLSLPLATH